MIPKLRAFDEKVKEMVDVSRIEFDSEKIFIANGYKSLNDAQNFGFWQGFKSFVLMQSTGLKDKNGTEIYEGDVIANQNKESKNWYVSHHVVVWHDTGFMGKQICSSGSYLGLDYWTSGENGYVVIGNIYENPELLEGDKK